jgi:hypothetical protein
LPEYNSREIQTGHLKDTCKESKKNLNYTELVTVLGIIQHSAVGK